jgi:hypothetical protein
MQRLKDEKISIPLEKLTEGLIRITIIDNLHRLDYKNNPANIQKLKERQAILKEQLYKFSSSDAMNPLYVLFEVFFLLANQGITAKRLNRSDKYGENLVTAKIYFSSEKAFHEKIFKNVRILTDDHPALIVKDKETLYLKELSDGTMQVMTDNDSESKVLDKDQTFDIQMKLKEHKLNLGEEAKSISDKNVIATIASLSGFRRLMVAGIYKQKSAIHFWRNLRIDDFLHLWVHEQTHLICNVIYGTATPEPKDDFKKLFITMMQESKECKKDTLPEGYQYLRVSSSYTTDMYAAELIARLFEFFSVKGRLPSLEDGIYSKETIAEINRLFLGVMEKLNNLKLELLEKNDSCIKRTELYQLLLDGTDESISDFLSKITPNNYKAYHLDPLIISIDLQNALLFKKSLQAGFSIESKDKFGYTLKEYLSPEFIKKLLLEIFKSPDEKQINKEVIHDLLDMFLCGSFNKNIEQYGRNIDLLNKIIGRFDALEQTIKTCDSYQKMKEFFDRNLKNVDDPLHLTPIEKEQEQDKKDDLRPPSNSSR